MRRKFLFISLCLCTCVLASAQRTFSFEDMPASVECLPRINLIVDISQVNKESLTKAEVELKDFALPDNMVERYHCSIKYRGASSIGHSKKSFALKIENEQGGKMDANLLGLRLENNWILDAMAVDRLRMRNRVCFDIWNEISKTPYETDFGNRNGTVGKFVEVFINGDYHGLYCLTDKIDRKLLGLKKYKENNDGTSTVRGILYKGIDWGVSSGLLGYDNKASVDDLVWNQFELVYPDEIPSIDTWQPLMDLIDFCSESPNMEFENNYIAWFYKENLVDYVAFSQLLNVDDNLYKNNFLSTPNIESGHRWLLSPWDMDMSLGGNYNGDYNDETTWIERYTYCAPFNRLYKNNLEGFADDVWERIADLASSLLTVEKMDERLEAYVNLFMKSGAWERERNKWSEHPVPLKEDLHEEKDYVVGWYKRNMDFLLGMTKIDVNMQTSGTAFGIYTLDGRRCETLQKGVNIVRRQDGTVRKILVR